MADIENDELEWAPVRQLETSDPALGGPGGVMNEQAVALVKRTNYLRALAESALTSDSVGSAAFARVDDFATAEQGEKADTAVQPGALGSAATADVSQFATAAQGAKADAALNSSDMSSTAPGKGASLVGYTSGVSVKDRLDSLGNLRVDLSSSGASKGTDLVAFSDPLAPAFLKITSDIINCERVSALRAIARAAWAGIRAGTDSSQVHAGINGILTEMAAAGYGDLYFPAGFYGLGAALNIPSNCRVSGVPGRTWLRPEYTPSSGTLLLSVSGKQDVTIDGIGFDGRTASMSAFINTVDVVDSQDVVFDRCTWKDTRGIAVLFTTNIKRTGVRRSRFLNVGAHNLVTSNLDDRRQAVAFGNSAGCEYNFAEDNYFGTVGLDCISISAQSYFSAQRNKINTNYAGGIYDSASAYTKVCDNHIIKAGGNAIDVHQSNYGTYANNTILMPNAAGVMIGGSSAGVVGAVITGNMITQAMQNPATVHKGAITLDGTGSVLSGIMIDGNVCIGNLGYGFYVRPGLLGVERLSFNPASNIMHGNTLGDFSSIGGAYAGAAAQREHTLATGESMVIMPAVGALANYAVIEVVQTNNGRFGSFLSRGTGQVTELQDLNNVFEPTDTGTEAAVFYDATSGNILLKNKNAASRTFTVSVRNIGSI